MLSITTQRRRQNNGLLTVHARGSLKEQLAATK